MARPNTPAVLLMSIAILASPTGTLASPPAASERMVQHTGDTRCIDPEIAAQFTRPDPVQAERNLRRARTGAVRSSAPVQTSPVSPASALPSPPVLLSPTPPPPPSPAAAGETIIVSGHRSTVSESIDARQAVTTITAEDVGKSTDQNVSESLQQVSGASVAAADGEGEPSPADPDTAKTTQTQPRGERYRFYPGIIAQPETNRERYDGEEIAPAKWVMSEPVSTFSVDVDTGAYSNARRFLTQGQMPPKSAVRTEEMVNYFRYDYAAPQGRDVPFTLNTDMAITPWNEDTRLLRIGLRGYDLVQDERPPANLVFLLDVSGSMRSADKLPLVKSAMRQLAGELRPSDCVSIVVYASATGVVLTPTNNDEQILAALDSLRAGGSTAGGAGIQLAYRLARASFKENGVNRVILATDGDFNVGIRDRDKLVEMIEEQRDSGITLTTLGFGTGNYNEAMMEQIANHGNGNYAYIDSALEARKVLSDEMTSTLFTIAHDVKIQVEFNPAHVSQYRLIGYENRALREQEFDDDAIDAGEIGAGHQVTALYEVVPAGKSGWMAPRRYQEPPRMSEDASGEMAFVKLRYKLPGEDSSRLIERPLDAGIMDRARTARGDMAFASAVAAYGQLLRGDTLMGEFGYSDAVALAGNPDGYWREEFVQLAGLAGGLGGE